ncbi:MAG: hypothetical protein HOG19_03430 [Gammaproteobacteria bacterium]|nr:hypothetical protein [Gammaproteobacteria bacterium]
MTDIQGALHTRLSGQSPFVAAVINNGGGYSGGATSLTIDALPADIDNGTVLTFSAGSTFTLTSAALKDATTLTGTGGLSGSVADNEAATVAYSSGLVLEDDDVQSKMEEMLNRVRVMAIVLRPISMIRVLEKTVVDFNWEVDCIENPAVNRPISGTYYTAEAVAESVFVLLDNYQIPNSTVTGTNSSRSSSIVRMGTEEPAGSLVRYKVSGFVRSKLNVNIT